MAQHHEVMDLLSGFKVAIAEIQQLIDDEIF